MQKMTLKEQRVEINKRIIASIKELGKYLSSIKEDHNLGFNTIDKLLDVYETHKGEITKPQVSRPKRTNGTAIIKPLSEIEDAMEKRLNQQSEIDEIPDGCGGKSIGTLKIPNKQKTKN